MINRLINLENVFLGANTADIRHLVYNGNNNGTGDVITNGVHNPKLDKFRLSLQSLQSNLNTEGYGTELEVWQKRSPNSPAKCVVRPVNGVRRPLLAMAAVGGTILTASR